MKRFTQGQMISYLLRKTLLALIVTLPLLVNANHEESEPSDGTVRSFIKVKQKMDVSPVIFFDTASKPVKLKNYKGKIVLLNIWATWCGPCIKELPALDRLQAKLDPSKFAIVAISIDKQDVSETLSFYQKLNLKNLDFYHDSAKQLKKYFPLDVVPANFILDGNGQPVSFMRSFVNWDDPLAVNMFEHYIQQESNSVQLWKPPHETIGK